MNLVLPRNDSIEMVNVAGLIIRPRFLPIMIKPELVFAELALKAVFFFFIYSITESEIAPLKSQLEELDTEITEMVRKYPCFLKPIATN